ncbi:MAG: hypothetical protein O7J95_01840 [Planctomycetota bacterium]|nr:hypothetical protein [Planctomycetota bacterium]
MTFSNPRELMQQLLEMVEDNSSKGLEQRLEEMQTKLDALEKKVDSGGGSVDSQALSETLKTLITSVLVQSGFLEKAITAIVTRQLQQAGQGIVEAAVEKELKKFLGSDEMKMLLDDKFRQVTLYLKTDVIPAAVRQALKNADTQPA